MKEVKLVELSTKEEFRKIKLLYKKAFPREERAPVWLIHKTLKKKTAEMLVVKEGDAFLGFVYMVCNEKLAYVFYLALEESIRGSGYGSAVLRAMKDRYRDKNLFLAREKIDSSATNYEQRVKRHRFYLKNGFEDLSCEIKEGSVIFDAMGVNGEVSKEAYDELIVNWGGKLWARINDMKVI